jgi:arsenite methyltransferase
VEKTLTDLGFKGISIKPKEQSREIIRGWNISEGAENVVFSAYIQAVKPG